jgi:Tfp pilus assembly protein PilF
MRKTLSAIPLPLSSALLLLLAVQLTTPARQADARPPQTSPVKTERETQGPTREGRSEQGVPKAAYDALERALKLSAAGRVQLAVAMMEEVVKISPGYFDARLALGNELAKAGRFNEAVAELEQARELRPDDERVYQSFGMVLMQQQKYVLAAAVFGEAARLKPDDPLPPMMRAVALIYHANTIKPSASAAAADRKYFLGVAEELLARASELSGNRLTADHLSLAMFYEMKGDRARAADELEHYLQGTPEPKNEEAIRAAIKRLRRLSDKGNASSQTRR